MPQTNKNEQGTYWKRLAGCSGGFARRIKGNGGLVLGSVSDPSTARVHHLDCAETRTTPFGRPKTDFSR